MNSYDDFFDDDEFREMLDDYERAVKSGQEVFMDADDLADIADHYQLEGRYDDAQKALERALELEPDSVVALNYMIQNAIDNEDYRAAEKYLKRIEDHSLPEYTYSRVEIWVAQGRVKEADKYLRECLKTIEPDEYQDFVLDAANIYSNYGYGEEAMQWMMRAKQENTEDFKELMARTLFGLGKYDDSERIFNELLDKNPFQKRYWTALANTQFMKEDYGAAISSSEYAIAIDPKDAEGILSKANGLYQLENYEEALNFYKRYEEQEPDDEFGLLHQGSCLINMGRFEEAVDMLKKADKKAPEDSPYRIEIYQELAFANSELKKPGTALKYIEKMQELSENPSDAYVFKGHILLANNRIAEAEEAFKDAIRTSDNSQRTVMRIIVSFYDNRFVEPAYKMFLNYFEEISPDCNEGYAYMALCCYDLNRYDEFLDYLKTACDKNPQEARSALAHLFPQGTKPQEYYDYMKKKLKL